METSSILVILSILIGFAYFIKYKIEEARMLNSVTNRKRGTKSEQQLVIKLLRNKFDSSQLFHDIYLEKNKHNYCQIDLVLITNVGIIVFEVKDYKGWIFGSGNKKNWTQVLAYGKLKYKLYNPIEQNAKHVSHLKNNLLQFEKIPFFSIIVFYGSCELKSIDNIPENTFIVKYYDVIKTINYLLSNSKQVEYSNIGEIIDLFKTSHKNGENEKIRIAHKEYVTKLIENKGLNL